MVLEIAPNLSQYQDASGRKLLVESGHQKDMCHDESKLFVQNMDITLGSIVHTVGTTYVIV